MKKLGIDFDDILFDFNVYFCKFCNENYGTNLCLEDVKTYNMSEVWGVDFDEILRRVNKFYFSPLHEEVLPVSGSQNALSKLKDKYELHLITSRGDGIKERTLSWLNEHFPSIFSKIHFTNIFAGSGVKKLKSDICLENSIDIMIEDAPIYATEMVNKGVKVYLLDRPWNRVEFPDDVVRVKSWEEIVERL